MNHYSPPHFSIFSSKEILEIMPNRILQTSESNIESNINTNDIEEIIYKSNKTIKYLKSENNASNTIQKNY